MFIARIDEKTMDAYQNAFSQAFFKNGSASR
jgi:hypothetical protein